MNNLDELKEKLIEIFKSDKNEYFENVKNTLSKYNGNDWIKYIKINEKKEKKRRYILSSLIVLFFSLLNFWFVFK